MVTEKPSEMDQLLAVLRQFRQELKAVGRVRDAHLIERAIDRVRKKQFSACDKLAPHKRVGTD